MRQNLTRDQIALLRRVEELGQTGLTQEEIAREVGLNTSGALHSRLKELGFKLTSVPFSEVRVRLIGGIAGERLSDLLARGELVAQEETTPAEVTA